jgi:hypothetical protein
MGYVSAVNYATGDDTQLMQKIAALNSEHILFLKSSDAVVYTKAAGSLRQFFEQRKRWASKIPFHMNGHTFFIAAIAFFLHSGLLVSLFTGLIHPALLYIFILPFLIKAMAELILLNSATRFMRKRKLLWLLFPAQFIYLFYIVIIGLFAPFSSYRWKERKVFSQ